MIIRRKSLKTTIPERLTPEARNIKNLFSFDAADNGEFITVRKLLRKPLLKSCIKPLEIDLTFDEVEGMELHIQTIPHLEHHKNVVKIVLYNY